MENSAAGNRASPSENEEEHGGRDGLLEVCSRGAADRPPKRTLFNDLRRFRNSSVSIITFGGEAVKGRLLGYDEVANCVVVDENGRTAVVFGKAITMVCDGDLHPL